MSNEVPAEEIKKEHKEMNDAFERDEEFLNTIVKDGERYTFTYTKRLPICVSKARHYEHIIENFISKVREALLSKDDLLEDKEYHVVVPRTFLILVALNNKFESNTEPSNNFTYFRTYGRIDNLVFQSAPYSEDVAVLPEYNIVIELKETDDNIDIVIKEYEHLIEIAHDAEEKECLKSALDYMRSKDDVE